MSLSKFQVKVISRLRQGDELAAPVVISSSGSEIGLGIYRFKSDKRHVGLDTLFVLRDQGLVHTVKHRGDRNYNSIELTNVQPT